MTTTPTSSRWRFARHYLEMLAAMLVGMAVLDAALSGVLALAGTEFPTRYPALTAVKMTFDMSVGMLVWMRHRGHGRPATLEMTASMFAAVLVLLPFVWLGGLSGEGLLLLQHALMLPLMFVVMLRRREEYAGGAHV